MFQGVLFDWHNHYRCSQKKQHLRAQHSSRELGLVHLCTQVWHSYAFDLFHELVQLGQVHKTNFLWYSSNTPYTIFNHPFWCRKVKWVICRLTHNETSSSDSLSSEYGLPCKGIVMLHQRNAMDQVELLFLASSYPSSQWGGGGRGGIESCNHCLRLCQTSHNLIIYHQHDRKLQSQEFKPSTPQEDILTDYQVELGPFWHDAMSLPYFLARCRAILWWFLAYHVLC